MARSCIKVIFNRNDSILKVNMLKAYKHIKAAITSYFYFHETWWFFIKLYKNEFRFHQFLLLRVAMATSLLPHCTTIITVYKITPNAKLVDLIGLNNLKEKWVGLHLKAILWNSPVLVKNYTHLSFSMRHWFSCT